MPKILGIDLGTRLSVRRTTIRLWGTLKLGGQATNSIIK